MSEIENAVFTTHIFEYYIRTVQKLSLDRGDEAGPPLCDASQFAVVVPAGTPSSVVQRQAQLYWEHILGYGTDDKFFGPIHVICNTLLITDV